MFVFQHVRTSPSNSFCLYGIVTWSFFYFTAPFLQIYAPICRCFGKLFSQNLARKVDNRGWEQLGIFLRLQTLILWGFFKSTKCLIFDKSTTPLVNNFVEFHLKSAGFPPWTFGIEERQNIDAASLVAITCLHAPSNVHSAIPCWLHHYHVIFFTSHVEDLHVAVIERVYNLI